MLPSSSRNTIRPIGVASLQDRMSNDNFAAGTRLLYYVLLRAAISSLRLCQDPIQSSNYHTQIVLISDPTTVAANLLNVLYYQ